MTAGLLDELAVQWEVSVNVSALKIHLSEIAHDAIMEFPEFATQCRGEISVKVLQLLLQTPPIYYYS